MAPQPVIETALNCGDVADLTFLPCFHTHHLTTYTRNIHCNDTYIIPSQMTILKTNIIRTFDDRLCGLVVWVWLQIQRSGFDSRRYQIFWEVVGLERGQLSHVCTIDELLERKSNGSGLQIWEYGRRDPSRWLRGTLYPQNFALTSSISGCRSVGRVRSRTHATEKEERKNFRLHNILIFVHYLDVYWEAKLKGSEFEGTKNLMFL
jgi:hypothetical protein